MRLTFHVEADAEVTEAARYYERQAEGLGSYVVEPDRVRVIAVAHQKRRPNYWLARL